MTLSIHDPARLEILLDGYRPLPAFVEHEAQVEVGYRLIRHLSAAHWLVEHELDPVARDPDGTAGGILRKALDIGSGTAEGRARRDANWLSAGSC